MRFNPDDTIAAIATPLGVGGVGIVRVSGPDAVPLADPLFRPSRGKGLAYSESHRMRHGWIVHEGRPVDEVLAVVMRAPHSYTAEDVVELHCHGGVLAVRTVLESLLGRGARLAEPGEFTMRAFFNGRLDLTQAEAVGDLIGARSELGLRVSANQLRGRLHDEIEALREELAQVAALVAAGIDFPEEDTTFYHRNEMLGRLERVRARLERLLAHAEQGRRMREGLAVAIVGRPNVGKSSLLNALLRESRAIVTEVPGTTRDTVEEVAEIRGLPLRLVDTAGIRETRDVVERQGIARSRRAIEQAELVLLVLDGTAPLTADDETLLAGAKAESTLVVVNKLDRMPAPAPAWVERLVGYDWLALSALTGDGLEAMEQRIQRWALWDERPVTEEALITNLRQQQAAQRALAAVQAALGGLEEGLGDELLAIDLDRALFALGDIVGETTADELLGRIFSQFCIGK